MKDQILANDLIRRLLNTGWDMPSSEVEKVVDGYGVKLAKSGYDKNRIRGIIVAGMRGFERKKMRCEREEDYRRKGLVQDKEEKV